MTVRSDLEDLLQLEMKSGETAAAYAKRLAVAANGIGDGEWETLEEATQAWVNAALEAVENKTEIPLPEGLSEEAPPEEEAAPAEADDPPAKTNGKEAKAKPAKKSAAKPKAAAKKAAGPAKTAAPKKAKGKATPKGSHPGPKGLFERGDKIKLLTKENPFRSGTKCAGWWDKLKDGMTVDAAIAAGVPRHHIRWELTLEYVKIG